MKRIVGLYCFIILLVGCQGEEYAYLKGFKQYMLETHQLDINNNEIIMYVLPLSDCNSCMGTALNLEALKTISPPNNKLCIVLVGKTDKQHFQETINELSTSFWVVRDEDHSIDTYQTGVDKPMLLHLKGGQLIYHLKILDPNIEQAKDYLMR
jgi:hypothetical protein